MTKVRNISNGPRGAYLKGALVMAEVGQVVDADDFAEEWFAEETDPLDHDGNGKKGGSKPKAAE